MAEETKKTADEIKLEAEQSIKNLATETTKAEFEKMVKSFTEKYDTLENKVKKRPYGTFCTHEGF